MNLEKELLKGHSRPIAIRIAQWAAKDKANMAQLMEAFFSNEYRLTQRAAWSVNFVYEQAPEMLNPYLKKMIKNLKQPVHDAVKRNTVRILQFVKIPTALEGEAVDVCFTLMADPKEAIAIKVFAMTVIFNLLPKYPELKNEFVVLIEDELPYASAAYKSRATKFLKKLSK